MRYVTGSHFQTTFSTTILAARKHWTSIITFWSTFFHMVHVLPGYQRSHSRTSIRPKRYPPWRASVYMRAMLLAHISRRHFRRKVWPHEKTEPLSLPFEAWAFTWYRYSRLATFLFERNVPKVYAICRWHVLSDAISDEIFGRTKKLNPYYCRLSDGL